MYSGKLSKDDRRLRREKLILYIRDNGPVSSAQLCSALGMSRSSLSDDLRAVNLKGDVILSPSKGVYVFNPQYSDSFSPYCKIDRESVRKWAILMSLCRSDMTIEEIHEYIAGAGIICSKTSLYRSVKELQAEGLLTRRSEGKKRYYHSDSLYEADPSRIRRYLRSQARPSSSVHIEDNKTLNIKIKHCISDAEGPSGDPAVISAGRMSLLTRGQIEMLQSFDQYPFAEKILSVTYRTNSGSSASCLFRTGLIIFAAETSRIYLIGKDEELRYCVIPLDRITSVSPTRRNNACYDATEFHTLYREMFQISVEPPVDVRVRFENYPFIRDKIERLCRIRSSGRIEMADGDLIYTDRIRGEADFSRFLRRFGRSAIVEEPGSLRQRLIDTSRKVIALYSPAESGTDESAREQQNAASSGKED